ncbi:MAG: urease accessory protein UreE [Thiotrichales bacterium]
MLKLTEKTSDSDSISTTLTLPLEQRIKSRLKVTLDDGRDAGVFLERGTTLKDGEHLKSETGEVIRIVAADESVSTVHCEDPLQLARACYHLGNRHVPLQITKGFVRYQHDHVLDDMVRGLGLEVTAEQAPFEPEPGAYGGSAAHGHAHGGHGHHHHH